MKTPREYQIAAAEALYDAIASDRKIHPVAAIPTGSGKTMVMCELIDLYLTNNPTNKILVLSHVKEILQQNYDAIEEHFYGVEVGLFSAGLGSRTTSQITIAGIQSVHNKSAQFKDVSLVIIDECHLVNAKKSGMYRSFLHNIPAVYAGLTATPFRTGHGYIHKGKDALFNALVFNICDIEGFDYLIKEGFLSQLIAKGTNTKLDTSGLKTRMNDFVVEDMSKRFDRDYITNKAVDEIIEFGTDYKKWLVFAIDIKHAEHIAENLRSKGITTACVHSKMEADRDSEITKFKRGGYRCMVNVDILTTGFDAPDIDLIAMLRPTESPILHVQSLGRGMRIADGKDHCLVLDFASNVMRLGPINDITINQASENPASGKMPPKMKECPACQGLVAIQARECDYCGHKFERHERITTTASTAEVIRPVNAEKWYEVSSISYYLHTKPGKPNMMRVIYVTKDLRNFSEYVCFEHGGYAGHLASVWFDFRCINKRAMPKTSMENVKLGQSGVFRSPTSIKVKPDGKYNRITDVRFY